MKKLLFFCILLTISLHSQTYPGKYNVIWENPGKDYKSSLPLGNGDISVNTWVEESGDLVFYIGKTDSWDEYGRLLKIGKVRVKIDSVSSVMLKGFKQTLNLADASVLVNTGTSMKNINIHLWADANNPVIHLEINSSMPVSATAYMERWRTDYTELPKVEISDVMNGADSLNYAPTIVSPDIFIPHAEGRIGWFHHNNKSVATAVTANMQGLKDFNREDPLLHRTFGAVITAEKAVCLNDSTIKSGTSKKISFNIYVLTKQPASPAQWSEAMNSIIAKNSQAPLKQQWEQHKKWWKEFWNRSRIEITSSLKDSISSKETFTVSRAYTLQRFITACAGRGAYPIKFNGSTFTVPYKNEPGDADYRRWGPGYWWQNTRLPYYPLCTAGDFDMYMPLFNMYGKNLIPLFKYRTKLYLGCEGMFIPECIYFWGDEFTETYGKTPFEKRTDKLQESRWHKYEWVSGTELIYLMLDYYEYTLDEKFAAEYLFPAAYEVITFFDTHYKTINGKLDMEPSQSGETWWECKNPMPEVAGLHSIIGRLLNLKSPQVTKDMRFYWQGIKDKLPDLPVRNYENTDMLAPAEKFANKQNVENTELYAVFPFRQVTFADKNKQLAVNAFKYRTDRGNAGWRQDDIYAAYLGLTDTVKNYLSERAANKNEDSEFPAFWGPNYDWTPDQTHGGVLMQTLQSMIMQTDGDKIYLLPAFPKEWNADFKLHAPYNTIVEGTVKNNKVVKLKVTPASRIKDVVVVKP
jgi:hypothetical protein